MEILLAERVVGNDKGGEKKSDWHVSPRTLNDSPSNPKNRRLQIRQFDLSSHGFVAGVSEAFAELVSKAKFQFVVRSA